MNEFIYEDREESDPYISNKRAGQAWGQVVEGFPAPKECWQGNQVLNFIPMDKCYKNNPSSVKFVETYFGNAKPLNIDSEVLRFASDTANQINLNDGVYIEMGVGSGKSINFIANLNPRKEIYGFDSFEGLPDDWNTRKDFHIPKGSFKLNKDLEYPPIVNNVRLMKGLFRDTLPIFKNITLKEKPISFIHVDCDLYESAKDVFDFLEGNIVSGTIIVFDEFYNYEGHENDEFRAFQEFLHQSGKKAEYIAFNQNWEQAVVKIL
ncbi:MAG TPA: TylF/MycF/NovP-related O-methyltransferase [Gammaproteobacteria bacterium]|nr:TylF/MycF/NovP-related O-methyltransferase [Gammaproteobacteria bacterium]